MKRSLWNITLAAVVTMVVYIALSAVWGAILNELENVTLQLFLLSLMTTVAYGIALLWVSKIRKSVGEDEVMADYREQSYTTMTNDLRLVLRKEAKTLILMTVVVLMTYILNRFDMLIFGKKMISHITFPYITIFIIEENRCQSNTFQCNFHSTDECVIICWDINNCFIDNVFLRYFVHEFCNN